MDVILSTITVHFSFLNFVRNNSSFLFFNFLYLVCKIKKPYKVMLFVGNEMED